MREINFTVQKTAVGYVVSSGGVTVANLASDFMLGLFLHGVAESRGGEYVYTVLDLDTDRYLVGTLDQVVNDRRRQD